MGAHVAQPVDDALVIEKSQRQFGQVARRTHERRQFRAVDGDAGQRFLDDQAIDRQRFAAGKADIVRRPHADQIACILRHHVCHCTNELNTDGTRIKRILRIEPASIRKIRSIR